MVATNSPVFFASGHCPTCGLFTHPIQIDDLQQRIRAEYLESLVRIKSQAAMSTRSIL